MSVDVAGHETWSDGSSSNQSRIAYAGAEPQAAISKEINELLCKPPGPWSTGVWDVAHGENCYGPRGGAPAHGATDLERPPSASCGDMSLAECQQRCLDTPGCTAVTVTKTMVGKYACYRKADVAIEHCDSGTAFSTYVRRGWILAAGFNCYGGGHGATDMDKVDCGILTVRACQQKCAELRGCSGFVWAGVDHSGLGRCFRKSDFELAKCDRGTDFDAYIAATPF